MISQLYLFQTRSQVKSSKMHDKESNELRTHIMMLSISRYRIELRNQRFLSWLQPTQPPVPLCPSTLDWALAWLAATSVSLEC